MESNEENNKFLCIHKYSLHPIAEFFFILLDGRGFVNKNGGEKMLIKKNGRSQMEYAIIAVSK